MKRLEGTLHGMMFPLMKKHFYETAGKQEWNKEKLLKVGKGSLPS